MRKRKHIAKALAFVLAAGMITAPINNIGNVAVASADESSETDVVKGNMDKFNVTLKYGAVEWNDGDKVEITKDGEYTFTYTVQNAADSVNVLYLQTDLYNGSLNDNFKMEAETVTVNETEYKVDISKTKWDNEWNADKPYQYKLINSYADPAIDSVGMGAVKAGDKITVKVNITGMNSKSDDSNKGTMDKFTTTLKYGAVEWDAGDTVETTKDGEYTFTYTVQNAADSVNVLYLQTDLYAGDLNDNFKMEAETVTVNETEYKVDTSKTEWDNEWSADKPYQYKLINSYADPAIDSVGMGAVKAGDKITVKVNITGMNNN